MLGADATIAWVDENGIAQAQDYFLGNYVQVRLFSAVKLTSHSDCDHNFMCTWTQIA
jgi:hypothetical protein